jgi:ribosomal protein S18 acetylase RimI-like enzyme
MGSPDCTIVDFGTVHCEAALGLWRRVPGMGLGASDTPQQLGIFLARNPGLSLIALAAGQVAGTVMAGSDGRRGYIYHACVDPAFQGRGMGGALMAECLSRLRAAGLVKVSLYCKADNEAGRAFWEHQGWQRRDDLTLYSREF